MGHCLMYGALWMACSEQSIVVHCHFVQEIVHPVYRDRRRGYLARF